MQKTQGYIHSVSRIFIPFISRRHIWCLLVIHVRHASAQVLSANISNYVLAGNCEITTVDFLPSLVSRTSKRSRYLSRSSSIRPKSSITSSFSLVRTLSHDAPLILLDEPTSNLDSLNETVILKALKDFCKEKTVLLVSHRKSTMCIADRVVSVENGRMS